MGKGLRFFLFQEIVILVIRSGAGIVVDIYLKEMIMIVTRKKNRLIMVKLAR